MMMMIEMVSRQPVVNVHLAPLARSLANEDEFVRVCG